MSQRALYCAATFVLGAALLVVPRAGAVSLAAVRVDVSTFKNVKGSLRCGLYRSAREFPRGNGIRAIATISGSTTSCKFERVVPGTYAVAVFHDENDNGKLDTNFFGAPSEGYGVSNNHHHAMSGPTWEESKFVVSDGETKALSVRLRY